MNSGTLGPTVRTAFLHAALVSLLAGSALAFQLPMETFTLPRLPRLAITPDGIKELEFLPVLRGILQEGDAAQLAGRYGEAAEKYRSVGRELEETLGPEALVVRDSLRALAEVELDRGRDRQAEKLGFNVMVREQQVRPRSGKRSALSHSLLVDIYLAQGRHLDAVFHAGQEVDLRLKLAGARDLQTSFAFLDLAAAQIAAGQYEKASHLIRRVRSIQDTRMGADHIDRIRSYAVWSRMSQLEAQPRLAEVALEKAIRLLRGELGELHPRVAPMLSNLSRLYDLHGKWTESIATAEQAQQAIRQVPNSQPLLEQALKDHLALLELRLGEVEKAGSQISGDGDPTLRAALLLGEGNPKEALPLAQQALEQYIQSLGAEHPRTPLAWSVVAECYRQLGSLRLATNYARRARERDRRLYSDKGSPTFASKVQLIRCLTEYGEHKEAWSLLEDVGPALGRLNATLREGEEETRLIHPYRIELRVSEAIIMMESGHLQEAAETLARADRETLNQFGEGSHRRIPVLRAQASLFHRTGKSSELARVLEALDPLVKGTSEPSDKIALAFFQVLAREGGRGAQTAATLATLAETAGRALSATHPLVLEILVEQAKALSDAGQEEEARKLWHQVLTTDREVLDQASPFLLRVRLDLARSYLQGGSGSQALAQVRDCRYLASEALDPKHPLLETIASMEHELVAQAGEF